MADRHPHSPDPNPANPDRPNPNPEGAPPPNENLAHNPAYEEPERVEHGLENKGSGASKAAVVIGVMVATALFIAVAWGLGYLAVDTDEGVDARAPVASD